MGWVEVDQKQHLGLVKERNLYKRLFDECLLVFNELPNKELIRSKGTYALATKIEQAFKIGEIQLP